MSRANLDKSIVEACHQRFLGGESLESLTVSYPVSIASLKRASKAGGWLAERKRLEALNPERLPAAIERVAAAANRRVERLEASHHDSTRRLMESTRGLLRSLLDVSGETWDVDIREMSQDQRLAAYDGLGKLVQRLGATLPREVAAPDAGANRRTVNIIMPDPGRLLPPAGVDDDYDDDETEV